MKRLNLWIALSLLSSIFANGSNITPNHAALNTPNLTVQLQKGTVSLYDFGEIRMHAYFTKDKMNDLCIILEKEGNAVIIESPAFHDNFDEFRDYLRNQAFDTIGIIPSYHPLGAQFLQDPLFKNAEIYLTDSTLEFWKTGFGAVMKEGIPNLFGNAVDSTLYNPTKLIAEGDTEIAGIKMRFHNTYDGFDIEIPEIKTVYVHILGHDTHSEILSASHLESSIANLKSYVNKGYETFLSSHYVPESNEDAETKIVYLETMQEVLAASKNAEAFIETMHRTFPSYREGYLMATTRSFFKDFQMPQRESNDTSHNNPLNQLVIFNLNASHSVAFKKTAIQCLHHSRMESGNIEMKVFEDKNNANKLYVYSRWKDQAAYDFHTQQTYTKNLAKLASQALTSPAQILTLGETFPTPNHDNQQIQHGEQTETLFFIFKVKKGYSDAILKRFETHVVKSRNEEGNILFDMYTIEGMDDTFVVYEQWQNHEALFDIHLNTIHSTTTGSLLQDAMVDTMDKYMHFVTEMGTKESNAITELSVEKIWENPNVFMPESVLSIPGHPWIYVSNVNGDDHDGFISRLAKDGKTDQLKWVDNIETPTGMGYFEGNLYVADQSKIHRIEIDSGKITQTLPSEAKTLNDITISKDGKIFASDLETGSIYTVENDEVVKWVTSDAFPTPNGLLATDSDLIVGSVGSVLSRNLTPDQFGSLFRIDLSNKQIHPIESAQKIGPVDGIVPYQNGVIMSDPMNGKLYYITDERRVEISNAEAGIADIGFDPENNMLYAPFIFANKVIGYRIKTSSPSNR